MNPNDANYLFRERISALDTQLAILAIIFLVVIDIVVVRLNLI